MRKPSICLIAGTCPRIESIRYHFPYVSPLCLKCQRKSHSAVSRLYSENKNVTRLIKAAQKYGFRLKLAGMLHGEEENRWLHQHIDAWPNIEYLGMVSDDELKELYRRAKVFALPSLIEGVGMVALEAAGYGAEVVLTQIGAPKEYFKGQARLVDPYSIDEIGQGIMECLEKGFAQPRLMRFVEENYSLRSCSERIAKALETMLLTT